MSTYELKPSTKEVSFNGNNCSVVYLNTTKVWPTISSVGYLTFTGGSDFTEISCRYTELDGGSDGIEFSNDTVTWTKMTSNVATTLATPGKCYLRGIVKEVHYILGNFTKVEGGLMDLRDYQHGYVWMENETFMDLFRGNTTIEDASGLEFSAGTTTSCYQQMFYRCTNLKYAPTILPAEKANSHAYAYMFQYCTNLIVPPIISAINFQYCACHYMFGNCESLTYIPELNMVEVGKDAFSHMFMDCYGLTEITFNSNIKFVNTEELAYMFNSCRNITKVTEHFAGITNGNTLERFLAFASSTGTLYTAGNIDWATYRTSQYALPSGGTIVNI